ncbi:MAG: hypothetical protein AAF289_01505 [Cyanobacteria bacterium P01_A01_bin.135]
MTDNETQILRAFFYALFQQQTALPSAVTAKMAEIAQTLNTRVAELDTLAMATPSLEGPYEYAFDWLVNGPGGAAERSMSGWARPGEIDKVEPSGRQNVARDASDYLQEIDQVLPMISKKLDYPAQVLTASDPVEAIHQDTEG